MKLIIDNILNYLPKIKDNSQNLIISDFPYNLSSKWIVEDYTNEILEAIKQESIDEKKVKKLLKLHNTIQSKGKAKDFMNNKWDGLSGEELEIMYKEFFRVLKHGGFVVGYGMDRQLPVFEYNAIKAGLESCQYLYSYKISNMPKGLNVDKAIDRKEGCEREIIGKSLQKRGQTGGKEGYVYNIGYNIGYDNITKPSHKLAQKYEGYYHGIAALKQVVECLMVFRKPLINNCVQDIYEYENGNKEINPNILNIEENRVPYEDENDIIPQLRNDKRDVNSKKTMYDGDSCLKSNTKAIIGGNIAGRFPSQLVLDSQTANILDNQSGFLKSGEIKESHKKSKNIDDNNNYISENGIYGKYKAITKDSRSSEGGCSRINNICDYTEEELYLQKNWCKYLQDDYDILTYYKKATKFERNAGCENIDKKQYSQDGRQKEIENAFQRNQSISSNNHPTLKSLILNKKISNLFVPPKENLKDFKVLVPFSGSGSEHISLESNGIISDNITCIEINERYAKIHQARYEYWKKNNFNFENQQLKKDKKEKENNNKYANIF